MLLVAASLIQAAHCQLVIEEASRKIDVATFTARHQSQLTVRNDGKAPVSTLLLCEPNMAHVATLEVRAGAGDAAAVPLQWSEAAAPAGAPAGTGCRLFELPEPLQAKASITLGAQAVFTHVLRPEPAERRMSEPQRVVYWDAAQLTSPYKVEKQATELFLGSSDVPSYTEVKPSKRSGSTLKYGPYADTAPFAAKPISVHYENFAPFAQVTELEREIQVSHWGAVYFEERYNLRHAGSKVVGEWSRFDLMTRPAEFGRASIPAVQAVLPPSAHSLYFRDSIGNISSSETRAGLDAVAVQLQPRYPLFGGWSNRFLFGWTLPLADVVAKSASGRMSFQAPIGSAVRDIVVDSLIVKVVLPEGARDPTVDTPLRLVGGGPSLSTEYTYLDVMGRPVVVLRLANVVPEMNSLLTIEYTHSSLGLLQKPLLLVAAFGALFAAVLVLNRGGSSLNVSPCVQNVLKPHIS